MLLYSLWSTTSPFSSGSSKVAMLIRVDTGLNSSMLNITPMDTSNTPQVDIQYLITRARARQLNLQVISFLRNYSCAFESSMLLQEFSDVFPLRYLQAFLPFAGLSIKLILFLEQVCPTMLHIGQIPKRLRRFSDKSKTFWTAGIYVRALVLVLYLSFWFQKKMAVGACV
jgi:hypothetical protein